MVKVIENGNKFCIETQGFSTYWFEDTPANRKVSVVYLRSLCDENRKALFTFQELAKIVGSDNRQAASQHMEDFRDCGEDFQNFVVRKKKVDSTVVSAVESVLMDEPLMKVSEITQKVNFLLGRDDLSYANIQAAMDQISSRVMRSFVKKQIEEGEAHYKEDYLIEEMMSTLSADAGERADLVTSADSGMEVSDPTSIRKLVTPNTPVSEISDKLKWIVLMLNLYFWGVPLSRLGQWMNVHKTTILRWIMGLVLELWPIVYSWIIKGVKGSIVYVDEKWIKIQGKWHYWFVVLDAQTSTPIVSSLLPTVSSWSCKWIGTKLKLIGKIPKVIITDGLLGYKNMLPSVKHQLCIFHHQQGVTRWLREHFEDSEKIEKCKQEMKKVFQTKDKRTVLRRLRKLSTKVKDLQITEWVKKTKKNLPNLLPAVGSKRIPNTNNGIERFFSRFNRFYKVRRGFHSVVSAKKELILFMVVYLFTKREDGTAPLEAIVPNLSSMPLYRLINDPFGSILGANFVKKNENLAKNRKINSLVMQI